MSDDSFFREVDEELRSDRMRAFWSRWGTIIIAAAVALIVAIAGWRFYDYYTSRQAAESGDAFMSAIRLSQENKPDEAIEALKALAEEKEGAYETLALLRLASEQAKKGDKAEAIASYDRIIADDGADENLKAIARIRAGMLLVDTGSVEDVQARVGPLAAPGAPWRSSAREALGLAYYKAGDLENAFNQFEAVMKDEAAPRDVQQRMRIMLDLIASKGGPVSESES